MIDRPARRLPCPALLRATRRAAVLLSAVAGATLGSLADARAADVDAQFVEQLQQRGWNDTAAEFIEWSVDQPIVSPQFRNQAAYLQAKARVAQAGRALNLQTQQATLQQAADSFTQFAAANPQSPQAVDALRERTMALARLAQLAAVEPNRLPPGAPNLPQLVAEARAKYNAAIEAAGQFVAACDQRLAQLPKAAAVAVGSDAAQLRVKLQNQQAEGRRFAAILQFESALLDPASRAGKEALSAAQRELTALSQEFRNDPWTRHYLGRCYQAAEEYEKALGVYETVVGQPSGDPELRRCQAATHQFRTECLVLADKAEEAARDASDFLRRSQTAERSKPEWVGLAYQLARAELALAKEVGAQTNEGERLIEQARERLSEVAQEAGEFQQAARADLATLGGRSTQRRDVRNFADAASAAREAVEQMTALSRAARLAANNNPSAVAGLEEDASAQGKAAQGYLEQALELADDKSPPDEVDKVRYYLAWIYLNDGRLAEAAELGEQLARESPDSPFAAPGAGVALRAYEKLAAQQADAGDSANGDVHEKLESVAQLIAARWPNSKDAAASANMLVAAALRSNQLDKAAELVQKLPAASRAQAELSLGSALWTRYLNSGDAGQPQPSPEIAALRDQAREYLQRGFEGLAGGASPSSAAAAGLAYLARIRLADGDAAGALAVLEHPQAGPLTLIEQDAAAAASPAFVETVYSTALSAYLTAEPPRLSDAASAMEALEDLANGQSDPQSRQQFQQRLTQIYLRLGQQLQRQMQQLTAAGDGERAEQLAGAFENLLSRVADREAASNWSTQVWLAQASMQIAAGLSGDSGKRYYEQAEAAFQRILDSVEKDPAFAPTPTSVLAVRKQMADCLRGQGKYKDAMEQFIALLQQRPNVPSIQQAAALTLEQWGVAQGQADPLERAIRGTRPDDNGKNLIWGWLKLADVADRFRRIKARAAESDPKAAADAQTYAEMFFAARYHAARARYQAALLANDGDRAEQLATAEKSIATLARLYPDLGGPQQKAEFDQLASEVKAAQ